MKEHLGGQKFKTDDKPMYGIFSWLHSQPAAFYAANISALPQQ
jgi:hypothetical protein